VEATGRVALSRLKPGDVFTVARDERPPSWLDQHVGGNEGEAYIKVNHYRYNALNLSDGELLSIGTDTPVNPTSFRIGSAASGVEESQSNHGSQRAKGERTVKVSNSKLMEIIKQEVREALEAGSTQSRIAEINLDEYEQVIIIRNGKKYRVDDEGNSEYIGDASGEPDGEEPVDRSWGGGDYSDGYGGYNRNRGSKSWDRYEEGAEVEVDEVQFSDKAMANAQGSADAHKDAKRKGDAEQKAKDAKDKARRQANNADTGKGRPDWMTERKRQRRTKKTK
jgi:hypothetical protein